MIKALKRYVMMHYYQYNPRPSWTAIRVLIDNGLYNQNSHLSNSASSQYMCIAASIGHQWWWISKRERDDIIDSIDMLINADTNTMSSFLNVMGIDDDKEASLYIYKNWQQRHSILRDLTTRGF